MTAQKNPKAWWREPMMWIVVGGPLSVVVAATVTAAIAWNGADPVLATEQPTAHKASSMQPALKARNHAADAP